MNSVHIDDKPKEEMPTILIIDDNPSNIQLAAIMLKGNNYQVYTALKGDDGLEIAKSKLPDLILLDIMMPEKDGFEVCTDLKENPETAEIPVIFLTAIRQTESLSKGFELGGVDYITKPFKKDELFARVKTHIELKRLRDTILSQNKKLQKMNEEKNNMMHITAHDLKNPIQGISGLVEIIQENRHDIDDTEFISICYNIQASAAHSLHIINDLLDSHAIEYGKFNFRFEKINLKDILNDIQDDFKNVAEAKYIKMHYNIADEHLINVDKSKFKRCLENLISNAIKFSHERSSVYINTYSDTESVYISIKDEGPGFSEQDKTQLFKKYSKLSAKPTAGESSTGLGLSIVKTLVENMNGNIELKSENNNGAEFILQFKKY